MTKCDKCLHKCKAECCVWVPFRMEFLEAHTDKFQRKVYGTWNDTTGNFPSNLHYCITHVEQEEMDVDGVKQTVNAINKQKQICPFLTNKNRCAIYKDRPEICRCFGTDTRPDHPMTCGYHIGKNRHTPELTPELRMIHMLKYGHELCKNEKLMKEMGL